jgi:tetratricopeptide (TPR) repeat protein
MQFNHLRRRGFITLLGAAAVTMWGCLGVLPGSVFFVVIGTAPAAAQQGDLDAIQKRFSDLYAAGNYAAALVEAQKLEVGVKARFGANHANYGSALYNLALVYQSQGKYADAEQFYTRALAIKEKAFGAGHPNVANSLGNLAIVYGAQGKYADAEGLLKRVLAIKEKAFGAGHPDVAATLGNLPSCTGSKASTPTPRGSPSAR